jgi:lysyl-tRNA synthetase class 2
MFNAMRSFFNDRGYLEVETPVLQPILEVLQRVRLSHTTTLLTCHYTCIANELYLKRLIVVVLKGFMSFQKIP